MREIRQDGWVRRKVKELELPPAGIPREDEVIPDAHSGNQHHCDLHEPALDLGGKDVKCR